jgi:hypothetical protein
MQDNYNAADAHNLVAIEKAASIRQTIRKTNVYTRAAAALDPRKHGRTRSSLPLLTPTRRNTRCPAPA